MGKDYYSILELSKNFTEEELKRSYRKQAMRWHPDKNHDNKQIAEEKFKEVAEAYDVLKDPQKRREYDIYGDEASQRLHTDMRQPVDPFDLFNMFSMHTQSPFPPFSPYDHFNGHPFFSSSFSSSPRSNFGTFSFGRNGSTFFQDDFGNSRPRNTRVGVSWDCEACTYRNQITTLHCEICSTPRKKAREWACDKCTFINSSVTNTCKMCHLPRY
eukprot:TRINITY_DN520_c0_g1_i1.p1 TRINITY_DN520_c0_g1~~TRINITY_DN520_c0_g1_i1.p1  ORF type:complete len:231 (-),score=33.23 TRINITY_DN520_c0_g1_i1:167-808(-)